MLMQYVSTALCVFTLGSLLIGGCSNKATRSGGQTSYPPLDASMSDLSARDAERISPGALYAKADPSSANRQLQEMRAEQSATAAAGLRDVFFGYDSWTISDEGRQVLVKDAEWLRAHGTAQIRIEGHCDERGSSAYNLVLAEKRAKSVRNYLMELGVRNDRLTVVSYGKERPFCSARSESCFQENRRGHLVLKPEAR
jgi:peptidoglycan-associated lipoprotein